MKKPSDGSRKRIVFDTWDYESKQPHYAAPYLTMTFGLALGLKRNTIRTWISTWERNWSPS